MQLILISGLSGAGKSVALHMLEDLGYYCVDNLPTGFLARIILLYQKYNYQRIAISVDTRSAPMLSQLPAAMSSLRKHGFDVRLLFLDAQDATLIRRYSETRRRHPLSQQGLTIPECIAKERDMLGDLHSLGHRIDTSALSANQLRSWVRQFADADTAPLTVLFQSFGFKHGVPLDADFVFDVRCLPNPYYDPTLRPLTGQDKPVAAFLAQQATVEQMYQDIHQFVHRWLPQFNHDNRSYLTISIGCTGGQHRSVYLAERLSRAFPNEQVLLRHRQLPPAQE